MGKKIPRVILVGRINAGKSTLFNTLTEAGKAIVSHIPGTTRDLNYAAITWRDKTFQLIDTGGIDAAQLGRVEKWVQEKAYEAIKQATLILFIIDGKEEPTPADKSIVRTLKKKFKKPIVLVVNKVDGPAIRRRVSPDFYKLGIDEPHLVSAISGIGTGDLLDALVDKIPRRMPQDEVFDLTLSIIGKTNVGKSSILNAILGEERVIVTPLPHTTREPNDTIFKYKNRRIKIVDTAGLRRKKSGADAIEKESVHKTIEVIKKSDVSLFISDYTEPLSSQDQAIARIAYKSNNGLIIVINKWDLAEEKTPAVIRKIEKVYRQYFKKFHWAPIMFVSAKTRQRVSKLLDSALEIERERKRIVPARDLKALLKIVQQRKAKPRQDKKAGTLVSLIQDGTDPPTFTLSARHPERIHPAFVNVLEKKIREKFGFAGTPIAVTLQIPKK